MDFPHKITYEKLTRNEFFALYEGIRFAHIGRINGGWYWDAYTGTKSWPHGFDKKETAAKNAFYLEMPEDLEQWVKQNKDKCPLMG